MDRHAQADWLKIKLREAFAPATDDHIPTPLLDLAKQAELAVARRLREEEAA